MRIGVLGGGQLGRMLALAGHPLGHRFVFIDPSAGAPMSAVAEAIVAPYDDAGAAEELARRADVATFEFENVYLAAAKRVAGYIPLRPGLPALALKQDRLEEKRFLAKLGIPTARTESANSRGEYDRAIAALGFPLVVKTRRHGYDGKGQAVLRDARHVERIWEALRGAPLTLEAFIPFDRELSILAVRGLGGETAFYPLVENRHAGGILRHSIAPAPAAGSALVAQAEQCARRILDALEYVGVLAVELFQSGDQLLVNEIAPRVHNSGHWTIEGAETSQFENHLRAICGWPLGSTATRGPSAMVNILGDLPDIAQVVALEGAHLHLYGKSPKAGRKLGHVTLRADQDGPSFDHRLRRLLELVEVHASPPELAPPPGLPFPS